MSALVYVDPAKCNLSYACIRACPAKAIKISEQHAQVIANRCIGCGNCVTVCSQNAISFASDKHSVLALLKGPDRVAAICDAAISGEFVDITDYRKFVAMIRALGFHLVTEMAFAVDLLAVRYKALFDDFKGKYYLTTKCPPLVRYIERFEPELVDNLAPLLPPHIIMSKVLHQKYGSSLRTVLITSCLAAKQDLPFFEKTSGSIDAVISFVELRELFAAFGITETSVSFSEFDPPVGRKGGLFPIAHGLLQSADINQGLLDDGVLITEGRNNFLEAIREFRQNVSLKQHLDLFYCQGCHMGPGTSSGGRKFARRSQVIQYVRKRVAMLDHHQWQDELAAFANLDLHRSFAANDQRLPVPPEDEILRVLHELGKDQDKNMLSCGACGYASCRDFAIAHLQGLTQYEMCYAFVIRKLHTYIARLNATNEKLSKAKESIKTNEEKARIGEQKAREAAETITAMLNKLRAGVVIVDSQLQIVESNTTFVKMLGEEALQLNEVVPGLKGAHLDALVPFHKQFATVLSSGQDELKWDAPYNDSIFHVSVFTIKKHEVVGGILRDLTEPEVRKEEITSRARQVIRENLETVQQIAFLLGESASKTEKTLNSIIEAQQISQKMSDESEQ